MDERYTTDWPFRLERVPVDDSLIFVVLWRDGPGEVRGARVKLGEEVAHFLRDHAGGFLQEITNMSPVAYQAFMEVEDDQVAIELSLAEFDSLGLRPLLLPESPPEVVNSEDLRSLRIWMYAAVFGPPGDRYAFVRRGNPSVTALRSRSLVTRLADVLTRIEDPILVLDHTFDLLVNRQGLVIRRLRVYDDLFVRSEVATKHVESWTGQLADAFPLTSEAKTYLQQRATNNLKVRRALRAAAREGGYQGVTVGQIREYCRREGLDDAEFIRDDDIVLDRVTGTLTFLHMVSEGYYTGTLTNRRYTVQRRRRRH